VSQTKFSYREQNVYDAALDRVRFIYDHCDDVIVAMSGGKDSTVLLHLAQIVATERGRLPLKVHWLDQEAEWQGTADYMREVFYSPGIAPYWWQFPFRLTNATSHRRNYLHCWDPAARAVWMREPDPLSCRRNPLAPRDRFGFLIDHLPSCCNVAGKKHVAVLGGMRMAESMGRAIFMWAGPAAFAGIKWARRRMVANTRVFWPIYDWQFADVWACIAKNRLPYNSIYDAFFRYGLTPAQMRVSALIHETSWHNIRQLQECEPATYERLVRRVPGISTFNHLIDDIVPHKLPAYFSGWRDYRDYLLVTLVAPQHHALFRRRWAKQHGDAWYKVHVGEVVLNDVDGTRSHSATWVATYQAMQQQTASRQD
jgi:predicted phosphoadenosine phosphosulfate sulfurtransferase